MSRTIYQDRYRMISIYQIYLIDLFDIFDFFDRFDLFDSFDFFVKIDNLQKICPQSLVRCLYFKIAFYCKHSTFKPMFWIHLVPKRYFDGTL